MPLREIYADFCLHRLNIFSPLSYIKGIIYVLVFSFFQIASPIMTCIAGDKLFIVIDFIGKLIDLFYY